MWITRQARYGSSQTSGDTTQGTGSRDRKSLRTDLVQLPGQVDEFRLRLGPLGAKLVAQVVDVATRR